jgi:presenilin-like A22 family membrane protease
VLTSGVFGSGNGVAGARSFGMAAILAVFISLVILVIVDLDRPRRGLIHVNQESMIGLQKHLETAP